MANLKKADRRMCCCALWKALRFRNCHFILLLALFVCVFLQVYIALLPLEKVAVNEEDRTLIDMPTFMLAHENNPCVSVMIPTISRVPSQILVNKSLIFRTLTLLESMFAEAELCAHFFIFNMRPDTPLSLSLERFPNLTIVGIKTPSLTLYQVLSYYMGLSNLDLPKQRLVSDSQKLFLRAASTIDTPLALLLEDDFWMCPEASYIFRQSFDFAAENIRNPNFGAVRFTTGTGMILIKSHDLRPLSRYLKVRVCECFCVICVRVAHSITWISFPPFMNAATAKDDG